MTLCPFSCLTWLHSLLNGMLKPHAALGPCVLTISVRAHSEAFIWSRHAFGDQYRATDLVIPGAGKVELVFHPKDSGKPQRYEVHDFEGAGAPIASLAQAQSTSQRGLQCLPFNLLKSSSRTAHLGSVCKMARSLQGDVCDSNDCAWAGVAMAMYNTEASIRGFAKASFEYALDRQWPLYMRWRSQSLAFP